MSSIDELKEKTKKQVQVNDKKKMDLSEMFGDQLVGKPGAQQDSNPEAKQTNRLDSQQPTHPVSQTATLPEVQPSAPPSFQQAAIPLPHPVGHTAVHPVGKMGVQEDVRPEFQPPRQTSIFSTKQSKNQKIQTYKMTFNIREDIHKAFHDLYANRILQGRATEKSEMICEAIELLINKEESQGSSR
jgi:hypothetical protein